MLAKKGDWDTKMPPGKGRGIAIHEAFGTIVGEIVEVAVDPKGKVRCERVVAVVDCGHVVNPRNVEMQIESGVIYGLTAALYDEITVKNGAIEQGNFDSYQTGQDGGFATDRDLSGAERRGEMGRHRRARDAADRARALQRDLRRHRQARPAVAGQGISTLAARV